MFEIRKAAVIAGIQALLFNEFPEALYQIQVGRIGRQEFQFDVQGDGILKIVW